MKYNSQIIAVDFDGTLCKNAWPDIGEPNTFLIAYLLNRQQFYGDKLILWTCRTGERLQEAVDWCHKRGLKFDAVNDNVPEMVAKFDNDSRKIFADWYIDDRAFPPIR